MLAVTILSWHLSTPLDPLHNDGYQFWSGIGSDLTYIAALGALLRHLNCHEPRCWRYGKYRLEGGVKVCRHHHPALGHRGFTFEIHQAHVQHTQDIKDGTVF